jgi:hypothetical protein
MKYLLCYIGCWLCCNVIVHAQKTADKNSDVLLQRFLHPPQQAKPWVFWYWMQASVSEAGIRADLAAMKEAGIGGAYLMPIKGAATPPLLSPPVEQLSPAWWKMVRFAMQQADSLHLQLAMHVSDGFALAGGPWITPELSMQKLVWTTTQVQGNTRFTGTIARPEACKGYYRDIAWLAFPTPGHTAANTHTVQPVVTSSRHDSDLQRLVRPGNTRNFSTDQSCWIQYAFDRPFTCRSLVVHARNNYQANRLLVEASDDGLHFRTVCRLEPPRHGWQDYDADVTHAIEPTTARFFRFVYDKKGSEPGAEDLDAAKWKPSLKLTGIELSAEPRIHQYEGKTAMVWRVSRRTTAKELPDSLCVPANSIIDLSSFIKNDSILNWTVPPGNWTILRIGHTSTGHTNATGGKGSGLECDKFNPEAIRLQFDRWFGEAQRVAGPELAARVLKVLHVDSWECGSQNWSPVFREAFRRRRGYDLLPYLPAMAGIPLQSADVSERFLHDVRQTITELVNDTFYHTLAALAHEHGCVLSAESVAPTMTGDGLLHYGNADIPMGEFWLRSPTHDKPNDMLDAVSGAHIYGKPVVQAEGFTELRLAWDEYPGMLKTLGDRQYALGINRLVYHVFAHNPWLNRKPGMTLDGIGLYFQRDQTWWKPGQAWVRYAQRCQSLLQWGHPVTDIAVYTGEAIPRRAVLPERLVHTLPGIFGNDKLQEEKQRLQNTGEPLTASPPGVVHSANITDAGDWIDPLRGYAYDSFNEDALLRLARVHNGRIELPGGASYALLVLPLPYPLSPDSGYLPGPVMHKIHELVQSGATVLLNHRPHHTTALLQAKEADITLQKTAALVWQPGPGIHALGRGRVLQAPYTDSSFDRLGITRDIVFTGNNGQPVDKIAWTHRREGETDVYFISNQLEQERNIHISMRVTGRLPELWDAVTGETKVAGEWWQQNGRTVVPVQLPENGSLFIVLRRKTNNTSGRPANKRVQQRVVQTIGGEWQLQFDTAASSPAQALAVTLPDDWSRHADTAVRYYAGTAVYTTTFNWQPAGVKNTRWLLDLGKVHNIASVTVNGTDCGVVWTAPFRTEITKALHAGINRVEIAVTNTWANRLIGDHALPEKERRTWTTAPYRLEGRPLLPAGLTGPVQLLAETAAAD